MESASPFGQSSRPDMPEYGILPETEGSGLLPWSWLSERMERSRNYWISTTRPDGRPHAMPVWGLWVDDVFYFSTATNAVKTRNLRANPALVVHLESGDETVILEGTAEPVEDDGLLRQLDEIYQAKYQYRLLEGEGSGPVFSVRPTVAFAWRERDFVESATRWRLPRR